MSQFFFVYNGQVALALLGGAWLASCGKPRRLGPLAVAIALSALALPTLLGSGADIATRLRRDLASRPRESRLAADYSRGLRWIRESTPRDALFLTQHGFILVSAFAERRVFYETEDYTAASHASRWRKSEDGWKRGLRDERPRAVLPHGPALLRFLLRGDPRAAQELRALAPGSDRIYLLVDRVAKVVGRREERFAIGMPQRRSLETSPLLALEFGNRAIRIYRLDDANPAAATLGAMPGARGRD